MCHGNHGNYFSNYYPPTSTVYVDPNEDTATDDAPFDLTDGVSGMSTQGNYSPYWYNLSSIVISAVSGNAGDQFTLDLSGTGMVLTDGTVSFNGTNIATVTGGVDGTPLTITPIAGFGYGDSYVQFMALIDSVRYANTTEDAPFSRVVNIFVDYANTTDRSFDITVNVQNGASIPELNLFSADHGTLTPQGSDSQANTYTASTQYEASTTTMSDGTSVVIWSSYSQDGAGYGIYGQRYDASGAKIGGEFLVNTSTTGDQREGSVTALDDGGFIVAWQSSHSGTWGVYFQRYGADGAPVGSETFVGTSQLIDELSIIDLLGDGFAIGWMAPGSAGGYALSVQRYTAEGVAEGAPTVVYDGTGYIPDSVFSSLGDGFVAVYRDIDTGTGEYRMLVARYGADGTQIGSPTIVSDATPQAQRVVVTELADGRLVLVWEDYSGGLSDYNIVAQIFNADGTPAGDVMQVNVVTAGYQNTPSVVALSDGGFAVSWSVSTGQQYDVYVRSFDSAGQPTSGDVRVNSTTAGYQLIDSGHGLTELPDGSLFVAFRGPGVSGEEIFTRVLAREDLAVSNTPPSAGVEIPLILTWGDSKDGSETMQVVLSGFPEGATFNMGAAGDGGTWVIDVTDPADLANLVMTPPHGYSGDLDISVVATSTETSNGDTASDTLTFSVHVEYTNSDPELSGTPATLADGTEDQDYVVSAADLLAGYSDFDGDTLSVENLTADHGTVTDNGDGTFTITPDADYNGTVELSYDVVDGNGGTVAGSISFGLAPANDPPSGDVTISGTVEEDSTLTASNTLSDPEGMGTVIYQWQRDGSDIDGATGAQYTLTQDDVGHTITVVATYTDGDGNSEQATSDATAAVANVNDLPGGTVTISGTVTQGEVLTASNTLGDEDGMGTVTYQWQRDGVDIGGATDDQYTLTQDDVGHAISVVASYTDGQGTEEAVTSEATGAVANANDLPAANSTPETASGAEDTAITGTLLAGSDADGDTLTFALVSADNGNVTIDPITGEFSFTPNADYSGVTSFSYVVEDAEGSSAPKSVTITVDPVNDAPVVTGAITSTASEDDGNYSLALLGGATDIEGDTLHVTDLTLVSGDASGITVNGDTLDVNPSAYGGLLVGESEAISYIYTIEDGNGGTVSQTATITIQGAGDGPVATDDAVDVNEDDTVGGNVLIDDTSSTGDLLTVVKASSGSSSASISPSGSIALTGLWGTLHLNSDGTYSYTADGAWLDTVPDGETREDVFTYTVSDGLGGTDTADLIITVHAVPEPVSPSPTDSIVGTRRADTLTGDRDSIGTLDTISGGGGADRIDGRAGDDRLRGDAGGDLIWGGLGDDRISGDAGNDRLYGDAGDDYLLGGLGSDTLAGGGGADTFVFQSVRSRGERDVITDFSIGEDVLSLQGGVTIAREAEVRGSTVLTLSTGSLITLIGVSLSEWHDPGNHSVVLQNSVDIF